MTERLDPRETVLLGPKGSASSPPPSSPPASGPERYRRVVEIAEGGMGKVFLVHDGELGRNVVMKVLHENRRDADGIRRFLDEARITARLEHPNIVPVYDQSVNAQGQPYFTMKMVRGVDLGEVIEARRKGEVRYSLIRILQIFQSICDAVGYAHDQGVIHRDLKPENVMHGDYGEVFVMDWGLAKEIGKAEEPAGSQAPAPLLPPSPRAAQQTQAGVIVGTPAYMPPEQAMGDHAAMSARSDIYSLGAILYEILTRQPPYQGPDPEDVLGQIKAGPCAPPRAVDPEISPSLEAICLKAMERDPAHRYASASEISEDIQHFIEGQVVSAEHLTRWGAFLRRLRRRPRAMTAVALGALLVGALVFLAFQRDNALRAELDLGEAAQEAARRMTRQRRDREARQAAARILIDEASASTDPLKALPLLEEAEARAPGWAEIPLARGRLLRKAGKTQEAVLAFSQALSLRPKDPVALRARAEARKAAGDLPGAGADRALAETLAPTASGRAFVRGERLLLENKASEALEAFGEGLAMTGGDLRGLRGRSQALLKLNRPAEALKDLETVLAANPADAESRLALASARAKAADAPGAVAEAERAWALAPELSGRALQVLVECLTTGEPAASAEAVLGFLDRHGDLAPAQAEGLLSDGIQALDARKAYTQAARLCDGLLKRHPEDPECLYFRARHLLLAGGHAQAEADCRTLLGMRLPQQALPQIHFLRARALLGLRHRAEALEALNACERLLPRLDPRSAGAQDLAALRAQIEALTLEGKTP